jgi:hypothetical protein
MNTKLKFTRFQLLESVSYMGQLLKNPRVQKTRDFSYFLNRNILTLQACFDSIAPTYASMQSPERNAYDDKKDEIVRKWALTNDKGDAVLGPSGYPMIKNVGSMNAELEALQKENEEMLKANETKTNEVMEVLSQKEEYDVLPIALASIPDNVDVTPMTMFIEEYLDLYREPAKEAEQESKES